MKTKLEIIEETAAAYSNSAYRATNINGGCFYLTENGRMCAVGRCLIKPFLPEDRFQNLNPLTGQFDNQDFEPMPFSQELFKKEYRGHNIQFWADLQDWHDVERNFDAVGISDQGNERIEELKVKYAE